MFFSFFFFNDTATTEIYTLSLHDALPISEIVSYLKTGSAYYAPSAAVTQMVEAIVLDKKRVLPCAAWLQGEYGLSGMYCGVPCKLGRRGLEQIIEVKLSPEERAALKQSAEAVKETMGAVSLQLGPG